MGLDPYLKMEGMVYRLMQAPVAAKDRIDVERMTTLLEKVYQIHPLPPHVTDRDEPYEGIANDYAICFLYLAMQLQYRLIVLNDEIKALEKNPAAAAKQKKAPAADTAMLSAKMSAFNADFDRVIRNLDRCVSLMSWNMQPIQYRHQFLMKFNQPKMAEERVRRLLTVDPANTQLRDLLAQALDAQGKRKEALEVLQRG
jgi:tetratricopeptide (TPR) repeat protein